MLSVMDWSNPSDVLELPIALEWAAPFVVRVSRAEGKQLVTEATRATIEALTRKLRSRKWQRTHTSINKRDGRSESRYYQSPRDPKFVIRISNHSFPNGTYKGAKDYLINRQIMMDYNVLGLIRLIEKDEQEFNYFLERNRRS